MGSVKCFINLTILPTLFDPFFKFTFVFVPLQVVSDSLWPPQTAAHQGSLSFTIYWSLLKVLFIEWMMPSKHLILCCPLLLLPSIFPGIRVFSSESVLHIRWSKYWSLSFRISPTNEYSELISFRIDWFDLLVQGTLKILFQHHSLKASILRRSGFCMVQLSQLYLTTGKTIALTIQTVVGKLMSLIFNMLSRLVIAFLWRREASFNFMAAVTIHGYFGAQESKICPCFLCFPIYLPWRDGTRYHDLHFWMLSFKPAFSLSSFTFIKRLFSSSSLSAIRVVSSTYLRLLIFLLVILIPGCASSNLVFLMMYSA